MLQKTTNEGTTLGVIGRVCVEQAPPPDRPPSPKPDAPRPGPPTFGGGSNQDDSGGGDITFIGREINLSTGECTEFWQYTYDNSAFRDRFFTKPCAETIES